MFFKGQQLNIFKLTFVPVQKRQLFSYKFTEPVRIQFSRCNYTFTM